MLLSITWLHVVSKVVKPHGRQWRAVVSEEVKNTLSMGVEDEFRWRVSCPDLCHHTSWLTLDKSLNRSGGIRLNGL